MKNLNKFYAKTYNVYYNAAKRFNALLFHHCFTPKKNVHQLAAAIFKNEKINDKSNANIILHNTKQWCEHHSSKIYET